MTARDYSADEEKLYRLRPLPDAPFIGARESELLRAEYEAGRQQYRAEHPHAPKED